MRYTFRLAIVTMLLVALLLIANPVSAAGTITLDSNGWSDPTVGDWDPLTKTGTLTQDVNGAIQINGNGITLDGNGHAVTGSNTGNGVYVGGRSGVTIKDLTVSNFSCGIKLKSSPNCTLLQNEAVSNKMTGFWIEGSNDCTLSGNTARLNGQSTAIDDDAYGIYIYNSTGSTLTGNTMTENRNNFAVFSWQVLNFDHDIDTTNLVGGKPIVYLKDATDLTVDASTNAGTVYCVNCTNVTIKDLNIANQFAGIYLRSSRQVTVENNNISNSYLGIYGQYASSTTMRNNTITDGYYGILLSPYAGCSSNTITGNSITGNDDSGIMYNARYTTIAENNIASNGMGIYAWLAWYSEIKNNTITGNNKGVYLGGGRNHTVYNNNFIDNGTQAEAKTQNAVFNKPAPTGGNYWSDWTTPDNDGDGFVDIPYAIYKDTQDGLPWTEQNGWANQPPVADAGPDQTLILGETVLFDGSGSSDPDGTIDSYEWDFGDDSTGTGETTTHAYTSAGTYTVTLTVMDDDGATGTDTATVTVQTPAEAMQDLISDIEDLNLPGGTENSLVSKMESAIKALDKGQENAAINKLNAFINEVEAQRGKKITDEQADELIANAQRIIDNI